MPRVSLKPRDSVVVGLIDDQDVEVVDAKFTTVPPRNYPATDRTFAVLTLKVLPDGQETEQYWSVGSNHHYVPDVNNPRVLTSSRRGIPENCQFYVFLEKLVEAGFPESDISDDLSFIIGTKMHVERIEAPERRGLSSEGMTVLVPTRILSLPGRSPAKSQSADSGKDYSDELYEQIANALADRIRESGPITKAQVITLAMRVAGSDPERRAKAQSAANDDGFYTAWGFVVENKFVKLA